MPAVAFIGSRKNPYSFNAIFFLFDSSACTDLLREEKAVMISKPANMIPVRILGIFFCQFMWCRKGSTALYLIILKIDSKLKNKSGIQPVKAHNRYFYDLYFTITSPNCRYAFPDSNPKVSF